jgi:hypothetical protein
MAHPQRSTSARDFVRSNRVQCARVGDKIVEPVIQYRRDEKVCP